MSRPSHLKTPLSFNMLSPRYLLVLLATLLLPIASLGHVLLSNDPDAFDNTTSGGGDSGASYGIGFTVTDDYELISVRTPVGNANGRMRVVVELFSNGPDNLPQSPLAVFDAPADLPVPVRAMTFTPRANPFRAVRLNAGETYWVVITRYGPNYSYGRYLPPKDPVTNGAVYLGAVQGPTRPPRFPNATYTPAIEINVREPSNLGAAFYRPSDGRIAYAAMTPSSFLHWKQFDMFISPQWELLGFGHFVGGAPMDAFIRNRNTGQVAVWENDGNDFTELHVFPQAPNAAWEFKGIADFNNDGIDDLLYQNPISGVVVVGITVGDRVTQWRVFPKVPNPQWEIVGAVRQFAYPNVYFRNKTSGQLARWLTNGFDFTTWTVATQIPSPIWELRGIYPVLFNNPPTQQQGSMWFTHSTTKEQAHWQFGQAFNTNWNPMQERVPEGFEMVGYGFVR